jgi:hypothetical protein
LANVAGFCISRHNNYQSHKKRVKINSFLGSVAKNHNIEAKLYFHSKDHKKAEYFSDNMQI